MERDYICLACGNHFLAAPPEQKRCSRCGSINVLKLSPSSLMGFLGGG